ncbi:histone deacetylase [Ferrimonas lipolytica]|uniref:Histone deacetylase n=1 Tax=Ferrimonas lipolytica TaxID=2724191 RepID=A0A6H1UDP6_9GAMM|nr:histone deacetylase [Ferrimonas lipolytica]QIZ77201.1 histone deacetylase [Ferrimonas lipolytica]
MLPSVYHPIYSQLPLPATHRYPIQKYQLLYHHLLQQQLIDQHSCMEAKPLSADLIKRVHQHDYVDAVLSGRLDRKAERRIGFPWSKQLARRCLISCGGTWQTAQLALQHGIALHLCGGYHHAHFDFGSGYCVFNDLVIAAQLSLDEQLAEKVMIIDCDVHQGDGTATLTANNANIISVSVHCQRNFPARKAQSDIDIGLDNHSDDTSYLNVLAEVIPWALALHQPDLVIYDAGVDIHQHDRLGYLDITDEGLYRRDKMIIDLCRLQKLPLAAVIGGGYAVDQRELIPRHSQLFQAAYRSWQ